MRSLSLLLPLLLALAPAASPQTQAPALIAPLGGAAPASVGAAGASSLTLSLAGPQGSVSLAPPVDLTLTPRGMVRTYKAAETRLLSAVDAVAAIPAAERTFANTVRELDRAHAEFLETVYPVNLLASVSPDRKVRRMAEAVERRSNRTLLGLADRDDIYAAHREVALKGEPLEGEDKKLLEDTLEAYKQAGMDKPLAERVNLNGIRRRLSELSQAFERNIDDDIEGIEADPARLEGLPEDYVRRLPRAEDGKVRVGLDYPSYYPFMKMAKDPELRRQLYYRSNNRAAAKNVPVLEEALALRETLAKALGFPDYAHMAVSDNMAGSPEKVTAFLERLAGLLSDAAKAEGRELLEAKRLEEPGAQRLEEWDRSYYAYKLKKARYDLDPEEVQQYFPVDRVVQGTLEVYQGLLGVRFLEVPAQAHHPDVRLFEISDAASGKPLAYFYLDLHPREGKYGHAAAFPIIEGRELPGGGYQKPVGAMVANFAKPTPSAGAAAAKPSLLDMGEVETFFHEFGHLMHHTLTRSKYSSYAGMNVALDFVEAPSQMMENFVWRPEVLSRLSGHYADPSRKLPPELLGKMLRAKNFLSATSNLQQVAYAALDLAYNLLPAPVDTTAVMAQVYRRFGLPAPPAGTHFQASFGHLMDYAAGYYSYLWSLVFAQDMFSRFEKEGVLNPAVGMRYRRTILERGSSVDEAQSLRDFLGREPGEEAFLRSLGIPAPSAARPGA